MKNFILLIGLISIFSGCTSSTFAKKYDPQNEKVYHYTYDPYRGRDRAIEDCEGNRLGQKHKDKFCEEVIKYNYRYRQNTNKNVYIYN